MTFSAAKPTVSSDDTQVCVFLAVTESNNYAPGCVPAALTEAGFDCAKLAFDYVDSDASGVAVGFRFS